jgi:membrane protein DedA with SNARE-associated domain
MTGEALLAWFGELPVTALYLSITVVSAIENVFPPFPADITVAFGSFLAARGKGSPYSSFLAAWLGNLASAGLMYHVGSRYGSSALMTRLEKWGGKGAEARLQSLYARFGIPALFVARFLPGVRALVPPFAGAMKLPVVPVSIAVAAASGIWFAFVTWIAFSAGLEWDVLRDRIAHASSIAGGFALVVVVLAAGFFFFRRARNKHTARPTDV